MGECIALKLLSKEISVETYFVPCVVQPYTLSFRMPLRAISKAKNSCYPNQAYHSFVFGAKPAFSSGILAKRLLKRGLKKIINLIERAFLNSIH